MAINMATETAMTDLKYSAINQLNFQQTLCRCYIV